MLNRTFMDHARTGRFPCTICGIETNRHNGWFLAVENRWLDRLKILSWHPVLAAQDKMQSVCGKQHLKTLIAHWLTQANLRFPMPRDPISLITSDAACEATDPGPLFAGRLVGELAVHRESFSRVWTGSPEALECILDALVGDLDDRAHSPEFPPVDFTPSYSLEYALH